MTKDEYLAHDATGLAALVREGEVSPRELIETAIAQIEAGEDQINAVFHRTFEKALQRADGELPDGPFRGVPMLLKDLGGGMAGEPFYAGTTVFRDLDLTSPQDSNTTRKLLEAGFVILGRSTTAELGLTYTTETAAFGKTRNPWDLERSVGGSSGGAVAAVAAGYMPVAHAGDGAGSIRVPASMTGLVGMKPSKGRVSTGPEVDEFFAGAATEFAVSRTTRDTAGILDAISGYQTGDPYWAPPPERPFGAEVGVDPGRLRCGVMTAIEGFETAPSCAAATTELGELLGELGHSVETAWPAAMDRYEEMVDPFIFGIMPANLAAQIDGVGAAFGRRLEAEEFGALARDQIIRGRGISASQHLAHRYVTQAWTREVVSWWVEDGWDLLVTPTIALEPYPLGTLDFDPADPEGSHRRMVEVAPYSPGFNMTGQPAISVPFAWSADGLPIGVQLVAAPGRDDVLLRVAAQLEQARPWSEKRPPQFAANT